MSPNGPTTNAPYPQAAYGQSPYAQAPAQAPPATTALVIGVLAALGAMGLGGIAFLIAGFQGHSAGWELLAIPALLAMASALVAGVAGIVAIVRKSVLGGLATIGLAGFGVLLGIVGFALGA